MVKSFSGCSTQKAVYGSSVSTVAYVAWWRQLEWQELCAPKYILYYLKQNILALGFPYRGFAIPLPLPPLLLRCTYVGAAGVMGSAHSAFVVCGRLDWKMYKIFIIACSSSGSSCTCTYITEKLVAMVMVARVVAALKRVRMVLVGGHGGEIDVLYCQCSFQAALYYSAGSYICFILLDFACHLAATPPVWAGGTVRQWDAVGLFWLYIKNSSSDGSSE